MTLDVLRNFWRSHSSALPNVDHLRIPKNIVGASVTRRQCITHLYLLEQFVSAKSKVTRWANFNLIPSEAAWKFYVNMAVERMAKWFELSHEMDLRHVIPPLDVLMVWHAIMQRPEEWDAFVDLTRVDHHQWDWDLLLRTLQVTRVGRFELLRESREIVRQVYSTPDLLEFMDASTAFILSPSPNQATEHLAQLFLHRRGTNPFRTPRGQVDVRFDFHGVVDAQLSFADRMLQYSWHRMYAPQRTDDAQFGSAIERYKRFMTLFQFSSEIQSLGTLAREPPQPLVPALDIDLVWRTHMLCPREFRWFSAHIYGRLIRHTPSRDSGFMSDRRTGRIYQHVFGEEYSLCLCWPCVDGRERRGFSPIGRSARPTFEEERIEERNRRISCVIDVPFKFGVKQCKKCGSHRRRGCKEKDAINVVEAPVRTIHQSRRALEGVQDAAATRMASASWWTGQGSSPAPEAEPLLNAIVVSRLREGNGSSIPTLRHEFRSITDRGPSDQMPWATRATRRIPSNESSHSAANHGDSGRTSHYTHVPSSHKQPGPLPSEAGPSRVPENQTPSYYRAPRSAASKGRGESHMGIDVGLWMARSTPR
ncbi:hypothetical protein AK830_g11184 [Neonectria ditissima]|uniref:Uncharacterized protein n=1 Tax=Neonectria ditissima TaxID=78410 RepID=A0A0P7B455_9HYPO|nr:hypothetical protein AK830_g11184 [Neonectria ditissima]